MKKTARNLSATAAARAAALASVPTAADVSAARSAARSAAAAAFRAASAAAVPAGSAASAADLAAAPVWECKIDSCLVDRGLSHDKGPNGGEMFFVPGDGEHKPGYSPEPVRLSFSARVRPLFLFRSGGQWKLAFDVDSGGDYESPVFTVDCGGASPLSFENAMALFFHPAAPADSSAV